MTRSAAHGVLAFAVAALLAAPADARRKQKPSKADVEESESSDVASETDESGEADAKPETKEEAAAEETGDDGGRRKRPKLRKRGRAPEPEPDEPTETAPANALELGVGGMALFRQLVWSADADAAGLGPYSLTPGPQAGLWLEFYPAAFATDGFAANFGLYAHYDHGFGVSTRTQAGGDVATTYEGFVGGLKVRLPLGTFTPFATVGYGNQSFRTAAEGSPLDLPGFAYSFVRLGAGTRVGFTPEVALDFGGAFLAVTDPGSAPGQVASPSYFPRAKANGFELGASLYVHLTSAIGIRGGLDWRQYGLAFYPQSADAPSRRVAGAVDRYIVTWVGLEVTFARGGGKLEPPADDE